MWLKELLGYLLIYMNQIDFKPAVHKNDLDTISILSPMDFYTGWALQRLEVDVESLREHVYIPNNYLLVTQT